MSRHATLLQCGCQQYDWGKPASSSLVASLTSEYPSAASRQPTDKFAELWIGTHPSMPSTIAATSEPLSSYLLDPSQRSAYFSAAHEASGFKGDVPFLLKVLSIGKGLSIQAHPNKELAVQLHARDPKNYKDPNHKPELIVALTPFEGLCCFRKALQVAEFARGIPSLWALIGSALDGASGASEADQLRAAMTTLYKLDKATIAAALRQHQAALVALGQEATEAVDEHRVFLRLMSEFPDDVGCWMVYILNLVRLSPGEGLFLNANEPHAYLQGDGVEIMATSDNVVRAGLTPKFIDVDTLLSMLTYDTSGLSDAFRSTDPSLSVQRYLPGGCVLDFSLYRISLSQSETTELLLPTCGLGLCIEGAAIVNSVKIRRGDTFVVTPSVLVECNESDVVIFLASTNDL